MLNQEMAFISNERQSSGWRAEGSMARKQTGILTSEKNAEADRCLPLIRLFKRQKHACLKNRIKGKTETMVGKKFQSSSKWQFIKAGTQIQKKIPRNPSECDYSESGLDSYLSFEWV